MKNKLFILDVSGYVFRAYYALPHMTNRQGQAVQALYGFVRSVMKLHKAFTPQHLVAVFDGPDNKQQRKEIYEKYKANRTRTQEDLPEQMELVKKFCELVGIAHLEIGGVEADDTMGSVATWAAEKGVTVYLCTSDKDLAQLVSKDIFIINPWKENLLVDAQKVEELYGVPPSKIIDLLAIQGDTSDNIPGLHGFGPKTAISLLKEFHSLDNLLQNIDKVKGEKKQKTLREEADNAHLSRRLATIHKDIPFPKDPSLFSLKELDVAGLRSFYLDMGFTSLVKEIDAHVAKDAPPTQQEEKYHLVDDDASLAQLIEKLKKEKEIGFDVEATSLRPLEALPVGIGFGVQTGEAFYVPLNGKLGPEKSLKALKPLFESENHAFFGHNVKYDCHVLHNVGITVKHLCFDTILASYLLNSNSRRHSLDHLSLSYFGKVKTDIKSLIGSGKKQITIDKAPIAEVATYCNEDVDYTVRLKEVLEKELKVRKLESLLYDLELPLSRILFQMERTGVFIDVGTLQQMGEEIKVLLKEIQEQIFFEAGEEFNISSPKQLQRILFEKLQIKPLKKTATGLSTRAEVLEELAKEHDIAQKIIAYRTLDKLRSTYIETLPNEVNPKTGRIHPTFTQYVAATGRLACQDPNLQNIPVRKELGRKIRSAFRPEDKESSYLSADYSQIELRLLAHLSDDPSLIKAFHNQEDIHSATAAKVFDIPLNEVSKALRNQAKAINFGIIYGQSAYGLSQEINSSVTEAKAFIDAYFERYPKVLSYVQTCIQIAKKRGKATTMIGRERHIAEINSNNAQVRVAAERLAVNTPLQGSAADLIKLAMLEVSSKIKQEGLKAKMILQVHDELIFETSNQELERLKPLVKKAMEGVFQLKVPLIVDLSVGKNWGRC